MDLLLVLLALFTLQLVHSEEPSKSECYGELGCLSITKAWYQMGFRTVNSLPYARSTINTGFIVKNNQIQRSHTPPVEVKYNEINGAHVSSTFNKNLKTAFIIHGFLGKGSDTWMSKLADNLIQAENMNVFQVNWGSGAFPPYTQASANTRLVGLEVSHFIKSLIKNHGASAKDMHIIGHSLGAQIAGYAGEALNGSLGRISGLDPAGPNFEGMPTFVRLDPTDAMFVDVIHTDDESILKLGLGIYEACGHVDFYPNGGHDQPGCAPTKSVIGILTGNIAGGSSGGRAGQLVACNHFRSVDIYTDSILSSCKFLSRECSSYEKFKTGGCGECKQGSNDCVSMGYHAHIPQNDDRTLVTYFLETNGNKPYCIPAARRDESSGSSRGGSSCGSYQCTATEYCSVVHLNLKNILRKMCHAKLEAGSKCTRSQQCQSEKCSRWFSCN